MRFTLQFCVRSISSEHFERFIVSFSQMSLSVRRCAESMNRVCRLKVKVNFQGLGIYPQQFPARSMSHKPFERFSLNFAQNVPFGETVCRTHDSAIGSRGQWHSSWSWDLPLKLVSAFFSEPFESFSLNFMFLSVRRCA